MAKSKKESKEPKLDKEQPTPRPERYRVCKGKAVAGTRIMSEGDPVTPESVGGEEFIDGLIESGHIEKYK